MIVPTAPAATIAVTPTAAAIRRNRHGDARVEWLAPGGGCERSAVPMRAVTAAGMSGADVASVPRSDKPWRTRSNAAS